MKRIRHQSLTSDQTRSGHARGRWPTGGLRGFSLLELMVVLAIATILAALLLPAMRSLRENVNSVVCSSNQRQIGVAFLMYMDDHRERFPSSVHLRDRTTAWNPQELMAVHHGKEVQGWDGLGLLFKWGYCTAPQCFYCPSHHGEHPVERYLEDWHRPRMGRPIYGNYHYAGHRDWGSGQLRTWQNADRLVIATDGLRTASDFNHDSGMNVLYGDGSVRWNTSGASILPLLPRGSEKYDQFPGETYYGIWDNIQGTFDVFGP